jgi:hypothetical protein
MKSNANNYAKNNFKSYAGVSNNPLTRVNLIQKYDEPLYFKKYESPYLLGKGDVSGTVWVNNSYNVRYQSPGISWVL